MSDEEVSLLKRLPLKKEFYLLSVEILNRKAISNETIHSNYVNGFLHTGEKPLLPKYLPTSALHPGLKSNTRFNTVFTIQL